MREHFSPTGATRAEPGRGWLTTALIRAGTLAGGVAVIAAMSAQSAAADRGDGRHGPGEYGRHPSGEPGESWSPGEQRQLSPAARAAIERYYQDLSRGRVVENRPAAPHTGLKFDIPVTGYGGVSVTIGINGRWGPTLGIGGVAGRPSGPTIGVLKPNPDGLNLSGDLEFTIDAGHSIKFSGLFTLSPGGKLSGSASGELTISQPGSKHPIKQKVTVEVKDGQVTVKDTRGATMSFGNGGSVNTGTSSRDQDGNVTHPPSGEIKLPPSKPQQSKPRSSANLRLTYDRSFDNYNEFTDWLTGRHYEPTPDEVRQAKQRLQRDQRRVPPRYEFPDLPSGKADRLGSSPGGGKTDRIRPAQRTGREQPATPAVPPASQPAPPRKPAAPARPPATRPDPSWRGQFGGSQGGTSGFAWFGGGDGERGGRGADRSSPGRSAPGGSTADRGHGNGNPAGGFSGAGLGGRSDGQRSGGGAPDSGRAKAGKVDKADPGRSSRTGRTDRPDREPSGPSSSGKVGPADNPENGGDRDKDSYGRSTSANGEDRGPTPGAGGKSGPGECLCM